MKNAILHARSPTVAPEYFPALEKRINDERREFASRLFRSPLVSGYGTPHMCRLLSLILAQPVISVSDSALLKDATSVRCLLTRKQDKLKLLTVHDASSGAAMHEFVLRKEWVDLMSLVSWWATWPLRLSHILLEIPISKTLAITSHPLLDDFMLQLDHCTKLISISFGLVLQQKKKKMSEEGGGGGGSLPCLTMEPYPATNPQPNGPVHKMAGPIFFRFDEKLNTFRGDTSKPFLVDKPTDAKLYVGVDSKDMRVYRMQFSKSLQLVDRQTIKLDDKSFAIPDDLDVKREAAMRESLKSLMAGYDADDFKDMRKSLHDMIKNTQKSKATKHAFRHLLLERGVEPSIMTRYAYARAVGRAKDAGTYPHSVPSYWVKDEVTNDLLFEDSAFEKEYTAALEAERKQKEDEEEGGGDDAEKLARCWNKAVKVYNYWSERRLAYELFNEAYAEFVAKHENDSGGGKKKKTSAAQPPPRTRVACDPDPHDVFHKKQLEQLPEDDGKEATGLGAEDGDVKRTLESSEEAKWKPTATQMKIMRRRDFNHCFIHPETYERKPLPRHVKAEINEFLTNAVKTTKEWPHDYAFMYYNSYGHPITDPGEMFVYCERKSKEKILTNPKDKTRPRSLCRYKCYFVDGSTMQFDTRKALDDFLKVKKRELAASEAKRSGVFVPSSDAQWKVAMRYDTTAYYLDDDTKEPVKFEPDKARLKKRDNETKRGKEMGGKAERKALELYGEPRVVPPVLCALLVDGGSVVRFKDRDSMLAHIASRYPTSKFITDQIENDPAMQERAQKMKDDDDDEAEEKKKKPKRRIEEDIDEDEDIELLTESEKAEQKETVERLKQATKEFDVVAAYRAHPKYDAKREDEVRAGVEKAIARRGFFEDPRHACEVYFANVGFDLEKDEDAKGEAIASSSSKKKEGGGGGDDAPLEADGIATVVRDIMITLVRILIERRGEIKRKERKERLVFSGDEKSDGEDDETPNQSDIDFIADDDEDDDEDAEKEGGEEAADSVGKKRKKKKLIKEEEEEAKEGEPAPSKPKKRKVIKDSEEGGGGGAAPVLPVKAREPPPPPPQPKSDKMEKKTTTTHKELKEFESKHKEIMDADPFEIGPDPEDVPMTPVELMSLFNKSDPKTKTISVHELTDELREFLLNDMDYVYLLRSERDLGYWSRVKRDSALIELAAKNAKRASAMTAAAASVKGMPKASPSSNIATRRYILLEEGTKFAYPGHTIESAFSQYIGSDKAKERAWNAKTAVAPTRTFKEMLLDEHILHTESDYDRVHLEQHNTAEHVNTQVKSRDASVPDTQTRITDELRADARRVLDIALTTIGVAKHTTEKAIEIFSNKTFMNLDVMNKWLKWFLTGTAADRDRVSAHVRKRTDFERSACYDLALLKDAITYSGWNVLEVAKEKLRRSKQSKKEREKMMSESINAKLTPEEKMFFAQQYNNHAIDEFARCPVCMGPSAAIDVFFCGHQACKMHSRSLETCPTCRMYCRPRISYDALNEQVVVQYKRDGPLVPITYLEPATNFTVRDAYARLVPGGIKSTIEEEKKRGESKKIVEVEKARCESMIESFVQMSNSSGVGGGSGSNRDRLSELDGYNAVVVQTVIDKWNAEHASDIRSGTSPYLTIDGNYVKASFRK